MKFISAGKLADLILGKPVFAAVFIFREQFTKSSEKRWLKVRFREKTLLAFCPNIELGRWERGI